MQQIKCQCECGNVELTLTEAPRARFYCHCEFCQEVYQKPYADVTVVKSGTVEVNDESAIDYRNYTPNVNRGVCKNCGRPIIARMTKMSSIVMIPAYSYQNSEGISEADLPEPKAHLYYHRKQAEVDDSVKKVNGPVRSQLKAMGIVVSGLLRRQK